MKAKEYSSKLLNNIKNRNDVNINKHNLNYKKGKYELLRIASKDIKPKDKIFLIRAGIHGDEIAGPLSILKYINEIIDYAHKNSIKLIIYPLGNPSGFENILRYNLDNDKGDDGNNDFMRYELDNGEIIGDLKDKTKYKKWYWSSNKKFNIKLPKETALLHKLLKKEPLKQIKGCLDLHQDYITKGIGGFAYHYSYGNLKVYNNIVSDIEKIVPLLKNFNVDAGFSEELDKEGKLVNSYKRNKSVMSNSKGFIVRHDGSLTDLFYRIGAKYCVTVETTGKTNLEKAMRVNIIWIKGIIDLLR